MNEYNYEYWLSAYEQDINTLLSAMRDMQDEQTLRTIKARTDEFFERVVEASRALDRNV